MKMKRKRFLEILDELMNADIYIEKMVVNDPAMLKELSLNFEHGNFQMYGVSFVVEGKKKE